MKKFRSRRSMRWLIPAFVSAFIALNACKKSDRDRTSVVEGEVVDAETGLPIAGITLRILSCKSTPDAFNCQTRTETKSGADGKYRLSFNGRRSDLYRLEVQQSDSIQTTSFYSITGGQKTRLHVEAWRSYPVKVRLVVRKNEGEQLFLNYSTLRPGPLDTTFNLWGRKNGDANLLLGVKDKAAGYIRGVRKILPISPGNTETNLIIIEDMLQLPKFQ